MSRPLALVMAFCPRGHLGLDFVGALLVEQDGRAVATLTRLHDELDGSASRSCKLAARDAGVGPTRDRAFVLNGLNMSDRVFITLTTVNQFSKINING